MEASQTTSLSREPVITFIPFVPQFFMMFPRSFGEQERSIWMPIVHLSTVQPEIDGFESSCIQMPAPVFGSWQSVMTHSLSTDVEFANHAPIEADLDIMQWEILILSSEPFPDENLSVPKPPLPP